MREKANLATELGTSLSAARSLPEIATACQEWSRRRMETASQDARHLLADTQSFIEIGARWRSNAWLSSADGNSNLKANDSK